MEGCASHDPSCTHPPTANNALLEPTHPHLAALGPASLLLPVKTPPRRRLLWAVPPSARRWRREPRLAPPPPPRCTLAPPPPPTAPTARCRLAHLWDLDDVAVLVEGHIVDVALPAPPHAAPCLLHSTRKCPPVACLPASLPGGGKQLGWCTMHRKYLADDKSHTPTNHIEL